MLQQEQVVVAELILCHQLGVGAADKELQIHEFDLIRRFFYRPSTHPEILLGNGDDCALLESQSVLAFSMDSLVAGTHFLPDKISPRDLGYRALAVNISDLAAMGAKPLAFLLNLTLPRVDEAWLSEFSQGLFELADFLKIDLIGGNTTQGPLAITIQIIGSLPEGKALKRSSAVIGDAIYVTGSLGNQAIRPTPRTEFAGHLLDFAHAAIDISDGLTQDLHHILTASQVGAVLDLKKIPTQHDLEHALYTGEDYELCFTAPAKHQQAIENLAAQTNTPLTCIGEIIAKQGLWQIQAGQLQALAVKGYQHF